MTDIFTPIKPRFIFDAYKMINGTQLAPLDSSETRSFSSRAQAEAVLAALPDGVTNASIVDLTGSSFISPVYTNYENDSDAANLYAFSIKCTVKVFQNYDPGTGAPVYVLSDGMLNVGVILTSRVGLNNPVLTLDKTGQVHFTEK